MHPGYQLRSNSIWCIFHGLPRRLKMVNRNISDSDLEQILLPNSRATIPSKPLQAEILKAFWPFCPQESTSSDKLLKPSYFAFFQAECETWRLSGIPVALYTYRDLLALVKHLRINRTERRDSRAMLQFFDRIFTYPTAVGQLPARPIQLDKASMMSALDLAVSLWLMLGTGSDKTRLYPGKSSIVWADFESLEDFIGKCFATEAPENRMKIERAFSSVPSSLTAHNLKFIGGFDIIWTDCLADHLILNDDLGTISLYHHASVLLNASQGSPNE